MLPFSTQTSFLGWIHLFEHVLSSETGIANLSGTALLVILLAVLQLVLCKSYKIQLASLKILTTCHLVGYLFFLSTSCWYGVLHPRPILAAFDKIRHCLLLLLVKAKEAISTHTQWMLYLPLSCLHGAWINTNKQPWPTFSFTDDVSFESLVRMPLVFSTIYHFARR
ncbi:hypothetical protein K450DRAFT_224957, partial [Umbelopsis ramanniana AG]